MMMKQTEATHKSSDFSLQEIVFGGDEGQMPEILIATHRM